MRLIVATPRGIELLRWIEGERSAQRLDRALEPESINCLLKTSSDQVFCGTESGKIYLSEDRGENWIPRARDPEKRAITSLATRSFPEAPLYVGTEPASVHVSRDGAITMSEWPSFAELSETESWHGYGDREPHVETLASDPHDGRRIYAGVEVGGAYRSDDDGSSWAPAGSGLNEDVHRVCVDPRHGSRVFAATGGGFYRSLDRGRVWEEVSPEGSGDCYCTALLPPDPDAPGEGGLILATASTLPGSWSERAEGAGAALFRSRDGARAWKPLALWGAAAGRNGIGVLARSLLEEDDFFVGTTAGQLHYALDDGAAWSEVFTGLPAIRDLAVV